MKQKNKIVSLLLIMALPAPLLIAHIASNAIIPDTTVLEIALPTISHIFICVAISYIIRGIISILIARNLVSSGIAALVYSDENLKRLYGYLIGLIILYITMI